MRAVGCLVENRHTCVRLATFPHQPPCDNGKLYSFPLACLLQAMLIFCFLGGGNNTANTVAPPSVVLLFSSKRPNIICLCFIIHPQPSNPLTGPLTYTYTRAYSREHRFALVACNELPKARFPCLPFFFFTHYLTMTLMILRGMRSG